MSKPTTALEFDLTHVVQLRPSDLPLMLPRISAKYGHVGSLYFVLDTPNGQSVLPIALPANCDVTVTAEVPKP